MPWSYLDVCPRSPTSYPMQGYARTPLGAKTEIPVEPIRRVRTMKMRIATLSLLFLCLALTASAQVIFTEGPIDGRDNALCVTGPLTTCGVNPLTKEDVSNG